MFVISATRKTAWHVPVVMIAALGLFGVLAAVGVATRAGWPTALGVMLVAATGASVVVQIRRLQVVGAELVVSSVARRRILDVASCVFTAKPHVGDDDTASTILVHDRGASVTVGETYAPGRTVARLASALLGEESEAARLAGDGAVTVPATRGKLLLALGVAAGLVAVGWLVAMAAAR
nr:hypothetical protein [Kofleriaceae bacterium]